MARPDPLHFVGKLGNPAIARRISEHAAGEPVGPAIVELDPTSFCDLSCPNCVTHDVLNSGRFTAARLQELAAEFRRLRVLGVILIGGGEPLLHPATLTVVDRLHGGGTRIGLVTNGTLVERSAAALARKCDWIRVSVDAATSGTYGELRPSRTRRDVFTKVLDGLRSLIAVPGRRAKVGYSFVVQGRVAGKRQGNVHEIESAAVLARSIGCDYVEYKAEMEFSHQVRPPADDEVSAMRDGMTAALGHRNDSFDVHLASNIRALLTGEPPDGQRKDYETCRVSALRTTVSPSGCYVCCYHRGNERFSYGDATTESFESLWAGRGEHAAVNPSVDCRFHCARHELNLELASFDPDHASRPATDDVFL